MTLKKEKFFGDFSFPEVLQRYNQREGQCPYQLQPSTTGFRSLTILHPESTDFQANFTVSL